MDWVGKWNYVRILYSVLEIALCFQWFISQTGSKTCIERSSMFFMSSSGWKTSPLTPIEPREIRLVRPSSKGRVVSKGRIRRNRRRPPPSATETERKGLLYLNGISCLTKLQSIVKTLLPGLGNGWLKYCAISVWYLNLGFWNIEVWKIIFFSHMRSKKTQVRCRKTPILPWYDRDWQFEIQF